MDLLYEIQYKVIELVNLALEFAAPFMLEVIVFMIFLTFVLGFISSYK